MKTSEVNETLIGRKVKGIENGYNVTGTIIGIVEYVHYKGVKIKLDKPLVCWSGDFNPGSWTETEYESIARKIDDLGNLQYTELI